MSQEVIERATKLARQGHWREGAQMLRPLVAQSRRWPNAVAALAYCHQQGGELGTATYLYTQAIAIQPTNKIWKDLLARCGDEYQAKIADARKLQPSSTFLMWGASLLIVALAAALTISVDIVGDAVDSVFGMKPADGMLEILLAAGAFGLAGLSMLGAWGYRRAQFLIVFRKARGEEFADSRHEACWQCRLAYKASKAECPFCGAARQKGKGLTNKITLPAPEFDEPPPPSPPPVRAPQPMIHTIVSDPDGSLAEKPSELNPQTPPDSDTTFQLQVPTELSLSPDFDEAESVREPPLPPIPRKLPRPPRFRKVRMALASQSVRLAALALGTLIFLSGLIGVFFMMGLHKPEAIREARRLQGRGEYLAGFGVINQYIVANQERVKGALARAGAAQGLKKSVDRPLAEAFLLRGQLALAARPNAAEAIAGAQAAGATGPAVARLTVARQQIEKLDIASDFKTAIALDYRNNAPAILSIGKQIRAWMNAAPGEDAVQGFSAEVGKAIATHDYARIRELWSDVAEISRMQEPVQFGLGVLGGVDKLQSIVWSKKAADWARAEKKRAARQGREAAITVARDLSEIIAEDVNSRLQTRGAWAAEFPVRGNLGDPKKGTPDDCFPLLAAAAGDKGFTLNLVAFYMEMLRAYAVAGTTTYETFFIQMQNGGTPNPLAPADPPARARSLDKYIRIAAAHPKECVPRLLDALRVNGWLANALVAADFPEPYKRQILDAAAERLEIVYTGYATNCPEEHFASYTQRVWPGLNPADMAEQLARQRPELNGREDFFFSVCLVQTLTKHDAVYLRKYWKAFPKGRHVPVVSDALKFTQKPFWSEKTWLFDHQNASEPVILNSVSGGYHPPAQPISQ